MVALSQRRARILVASAVALLCAYWPGSSTAELLPEPTTTSPWPALPTAEEVPLLPMRPKLHAARLWALYTAIYGVGWLPTGDYNKVPYTAADVLSTGGTGARLEAGWFRRRSARFFCQHRD